MPCPLAHLQGTPIYKEARLNGSYCLGKNATLKLLIKAEQSPEGKE